MTVKEIDLPNGFRKGTRRKVKTVEKLIAELQQLPPRMKVLGEYDSGVRVVVTNFNDRCLAVTFDTSLS